MVDADATSFLKFRPFPPRVTPPINLKPYTRYLVSTTYLSLFLRFCRLHNAGVKALKKHISNDVVYHLMSCLISVSLQLCFPQPGLGSLRSSTCTPTRRCRLKVPANTPKCFAKWFCHHETRSFYLYLEARHILLE